LACVPLYTGSIKPHGVFLLAVCEPGIGRICYLDGDLLISQGQEINLWNENEISLQIRSAKPKSIPGYINLYSSRQVDLIGNEKTDLSLEEKENHFYRIRF